MSQEVPINIGMRAPVKPESKHSRAKEVASWVFDIIFLGGLIWYFVMPGNTERFWGAISGHTNKAIVAVFGKLQESGISLAASDHQPAVAIQTKTPPPPVFSPPPLPTHEQLAKEVPGNCFPPNSSASFGRCPCFAGASRPMPL